MRAIGRRYRQFIETETQPKTYFSSLRSGRRSDEGAAEEGVEERLEGSESEALEVAVDLSDLEARSFARSEDLPALGSTRPPPRPEDSFFEEDMSLRTKRGGTQVSQGEVGMRKTGKSDRARRPFFESGSLLVALASRSRSRIRCLRQPIFKFLSNTYGERWPLTPHWLPL